MEAVAIGLGSGWDRVHAPSVAAMNEVIASITIVRAAIAMVATLDIDEATHPMWDLFADAEEIFESARSRRLSKWFDRVRGQC